LLDGLIVAEHQAVPTAFQFLYTPFSNHRLPYCLTMAQQSNNQTIKQSNHLTIQLHN